MRGGNSHTAKFKAVILSLLCSFLPQGQAEHSWQWARSGKTIGDDRLGKVPCRCHSSHTGALALSQDTSILPSDIPSAQCPASSGIPQLARYVKSLGSAPQETSRAVCPRQGASRAARYQLFDIALRCDLIIAKASRYHISIYRIARYRMSISQYRCRNIDIANSVEPCYV